MYQQVLNTQCDEFNCLQDHVPRGAETLAEGFNKVRCPKWWSGSESKMYSRRGTSLSPSDRILIRACSDQTWPDIQPGGPSVLKGPSLGAQVLIQR